MASTRRKAPTRPKQRPEDALVDGIAALSISKPQSKADQRLASMRAVNTASQELSALVQSGWNKSADASTKSANATKAAAAATAASKHLALLRDASPGDVDIERAAGSVLGKLVALEMFDVALPALKEMHPRICAILNVPVVPRKTTEFLHLLSFPLPQPPPSPVMLHLASTFLLHSLLSIAALPLAKKAISALATTLVDAPTLLEWAPTLATLPPAQIDSMLTRAYSSIMKVAATLQSELSTVWEAFILRDYAVRCLIRTSPGKIEPRMFWEQCVKAGGAYIKALGSAPDTAVQTISNAFARVIALAQAREDAETFVGGKGFLSFCEYWTSLANRLGDIDTLDRVAVFIGSQPGPSNSRKPQVQPVSDDDLLLQCTQLSTTLSQTTALLDLKTSPSDTDQLRSSIIRATSFLRVDAVSAIFSGPRGGEQDRVSGKVQRAMERTRRSALKYLEADEVRVLEVHDLLGVILDVLEDALRKSNSPSDYLTSALDTLFSLARAKINANDTSSHTTTHSLLQRAIALLETCPEDNLDKANYARCVSGAFHNIAATLYQAGKYSAAIRFLQDGCNLGKRAFDMYRRVSSCTEQDTKAVEAWSQLEEQLWRRYELLGVCSSKIGDRKLAFDSFVDAARSYPHLHYGFSIKADSDTVETVFQTTTGGLQLANIVDRLTHIGVFDLFLAPDKVSLYDTDPSVAGLLLERQIRALEGSRGKANSRVATRALFADALKLYSEETPLRRARVLVRVLEFVYHVGPGEVSELGSPGEIGEQVANLLARKDFGRDCKLASFAPQYRASAQLWLALHSHRQADGEQSLKVALHIELACTALEPVVGLVAPLEPTPKAIKGKAPMAPNGKKPAPARRAPPAKKAPPAKNPVTPQPRARKAEATPLAPSNSQPSAFEEFGKLVDLLNLITSILGLLAQVLLRVRLLEITKRLCEQNSATDAYLVASSELALEYMKLGKGKRANAIFAQSFEKIRGQKLTDGVAAMFYLRHAECMAMAEDLSRSSEFYNEALARAQLVADEPKTMSTVERVHFRVGKLERAAIACYVFALIQNCREETAVSLETILQSLRLWNRALDALTRLRPQPAKPMEDDNPFNVSSKSDSGSTEQVMPAKAFPRRPAMDSVEWRVCDGLLATLFALCDAYFVRGSPKEAEYFAQQALDLATSLNAPAMAARALAKKGEIQLHQRHLADAHDTLLQAREMLQNIPGRDTAEIHRLRGDYNHLSSQEQDASQLYAEATNILEGLDKSFGVFDDIAASRRASELAAVEILHPELLATVLRQHIWLSRDLGDDRARLLQRFLALPAGPRSKAQENGLIARLTLHEVYERFNEDLFLNSLTESTIALPMGMSTDKVIALSPSTHDILRTLEQAEHLFWLEFTLFSRRGDVPRVRAATVSLALIRALQTSLGKSGKQDPVLVAGLLDVSSAITLSREMLEAVQHKFPPPNMVDDLEWPLASRQGTPIVREKRLAPPRRNLGFDSDIEVSDDEPDEDEQALQDYWEYIRAKYQGQAPDISTMSASQMAGIPRNWTVIHIGVTDDRSTLFVTRQYGDDTATNPLVFCVPLKDRREGEQSDHLTFDDAMREFDDIIRLSDEGTRSAINVKDKPEARSLWWKERTALDLRLRELLENIEYCWLGAFKTILSPRTNLSASAITELRREFDKVFQHSLRFQDKNFKARPPLATHRRAVSESQVPSKVTLDDVLLETFATLSPKCRDEELEDLVFFTLDLYQFHGVQVAIAEVDVDQVVVDLRTVLENHHARLSGRRRGEPAVTMVEQDEHTFLILDKNIQGLPWESIPALRGRSVSRIPSVDFLLDRLQFANWGSKVKDGVVDRANIDPRKGYCLLNPSGDLTRTEGRFKEWFKSMESVGWQGVVGRPPTEQQLLDALRKQDLVVYFGHGGAEQYVRSHKIRQLPRCAATMLWGCSSGILREMGDFDRVGTPNNYMIAGCPTLVANMWDVTDRDIDVFSQAVFDKLQLDADGARNWDGTGKTSLVTAVAQSRTSCKLKYLTGAAPVVYGIPFYL
ncbi:Cysteine peptidase C50 [Mycena kentingensis (nom. inval.)]|nr:Cysteine peptidase C50 [Mycena kentingensis (nom. inval.)]